MIPSGRDCKEIERKKSSKSSENKAKAGNFRSSEVNFGTRVPLQDRAPFRKTTLAIKRENPDFNQSSIRRYFAIAKVILAHVCHFAAHAPFLQTVHLLARARHRANLRSSSPVINSGQISATQNGANRMSQVFLSFKPQESPKRSPFRIPFLSLHGQKFLLAVPKPSRFLASSISVPSPAPEPQEPQPPLPEPQIPAEIAPEEIIRRPMLTQPPIEGNLDCRARPFHSELCFDIATFQLRPELAQSFHLLRRYHMEHLLTPRDFFYPRVAMDFYQSMTTKQVRDPTLIHFTIDGRHGILGTRHIAEALQIPYSRAILMILKSGPGALSWKWCISYLRSFYTITSVEGSFLQSCFLLMHFAS
ncbi:hypothetical protein AAG906_007817 [Vitis piasezkii]